MKKNIIIIALACIIVVLTVFLLINYRQKISLDTSMDKTKLEAYIVSDSRCTDCTQAVSSLKSQLQQMFVGIAFKEYNYSDSSGKTFYEKYKLTTLPAIIFTEAIKTQTNYSQISSYIAPNETDQTLLMLNLGATFDPTKEICDNQKDDTGNGKVDCDDSDCDGNTVCRENQANKLDLFVMSHCPYGVQALDAMKEVITNFKNKIDFNIHFIASETSSGQFNSLHGQAEVDENIRELCAIKYYPENYKYMDYIWCINKEIAKGTTYNWESCGADFPKIKSCFTGAEGKQLLTENIKLANELQIGASPTWFANNKYTFSGIDSETIKTNICKYNTDLGDMCSNTLSSTSQTSAGSCD